MIAVYPSHHVRHRPPHEIYNGNRDSHAEVPDRVEVIKNAISSIRGIRIQLPKRFPLRHIEDIHSSEYISYLAASGRMAGSTYVYPSVFPYAPGQKTGHEIGLRGQYSFDMYTPVSNTTYLCAHASAMAAITAASLVRRGARASYALCRPPGHHAERAKMGGYCYFNNASIAAHYLSKFGTVAVFDIDVHHGNGTQAIFYDRSDVFTVSIHGNPDSLYPYFSGRVEEDGVGSGHGFNANFPLSLGTQDRLYNAAFGSAIDRIIAFSPTYLIVAVGYDAHEADPIGRFGLTTAYYKHIARTIADLHIPTVLVQEGGYNVAKLGEISESFISGFLSS